MSLVSFFVALHGPLSRPLADPSRASSNPLVVLRRSSCPFVDIFFPLPLHGPLSSLFQPLGVPSRTPLSRPLADPSRASSNALVALRRSSCFVDNSFSPWCLSSWPFTDPFRVFSNPLESLRGPLDRYQLLPGNPPFDLWRIPLVPPPTPSWPFAVLRAPSWISFCLFLRGPPWTDTSAPSWKSFPSFGGSLSPPPTFVALRRSSCPFVDIFLSFVSFLVALHGPLSSLFQPLGVPSRTPFPTFGGSLSCLLQPLSGPSRSFVPLRGYPFVLSVFLRGPSRTPFESFPTPWSPFADPLPDLWRIPLVPPPTP